MPYASLYTTPKKTAVQILTAMAGVQYTIIKHQENIARAFELQWMNKSAETGSKQSN